MSAAAQVARRRASFRVLSASIVRDCKHLPHIQDCYSAVVAEDANRYNPAFFLASVSPQSWEPAVVIIRDDNQSPIAILYAKQRKLFGFRTGLFFADATLGSLIAGDSSYQEEAFWIGMRTLVADGRLRGLRLLAPPSGHEVALLSALASRQGFEFRVVPAESHLVLPLTATYEEFLARLGSKTRRNFRYYRNRSENAGHQYVENLSLEEFSPAAWNLESQAPVGGDTEGLRRALKMFQTADRPLLAGLRSADGELVSVIGGWYEKNRVVIFMQLNSDKRHAKYSLSLVIRAHLIETLIQHGFREIVWWAGVGEPISHYCVPVPTAWVYLDRPSASWRVVRNLIDRNRDWLPARLRSIAGWMVPPPVISLVPSCSGEPE